MPEDHDSSSGTQNPNKGKNDARGVTDQAKEKQGGSGEIICCRSRSRAEQCCSLYKGKQCLQVKGSKAHHSRACSHPRL